VKELLSREGYTFTVKNVDEEHGAYTELLALGFRSVPVTIVGGTAVKGFDEIRLRDALRSAGGP
jgi:glutaredoxin-like protein NrdH